MFELPLVGAGGEPVDFRATIGSHGLGWLAPNLVDLAPPASLTTTLDLGDVARRVVLTSPVTGVLAVDVATPRVTRGELAEIRRQIAAVFALDLDLSAFHARAARDPSLAWTASGIGRMLRSPTAFEDVARTLCTTNCTWSGTKRMIGALVEHLGSVAPATRGAPPSRAFPSAARIVASDPAILHDVARMGYRAPFLRAIAQGVARGTTDLEALRATTAVDLSDDDLDRRLRELPGFGPYASAHTMMLFGRRSRLVLDSWTRPTYAKLVRRKSVPDATIERRFRRTYGDDAGLAFWLFLWRERHLAETPLPDLA